MLSTPNMSLVSWDQPNDDFTHQQLAANWDALDKHDHGPGRGVTIGGPGIADNAITGTKLASNSVDNTKLTSGAVASDNIQANAITHDLMAPGSVYGNVIPDQGVTMNMLDTNILPLGMVMHWYRGAGQTHLPGGGWEIMDGRPWASIPNDLGLNSGRIPDMRKQFPRGADIFDPLYAIGLGGGYEFIDLRHNHYVNPHGHAFPPHRHGIGFDGRHNHLWFGGFNVWTRPNAFAEEITIRDELNALRYNSSYTLYLKSMQNSPFWDDSAVDFRTDMDHDGHHDHGGWVDFDDGLESLNADSDTDDQLGQHSIIPNHVHLLYLMLVRRSPTPISQPPVVIPPISDQRGEMNTPGGYVIYADHGNIPWYNAPSVLYPGGEAYATAPHRGTAPVTWYLGGKSFGFHVPSDAVITGVIAQVVTRSTFANQAVTDSVRLMVDGRHDQGANRATVNRISSNLELLTFGGTDDLWGFGSLSPAQVNDPNFGFVWSAAMGNGTNVFVDNLRMVVYYAELS